MYETNHQGFFLFPVLESFQFKVKLISQVNLLTFSETKITICKAHLFLKALKTERNPIMTSSLSSW